MNPLLCAAATLALFTCSAAASANPKLAAPNYDIPGAMAVPARPKAIGNTPGVGTPMAHANRLYPPSCASWPLPDKPSGSTWSATVPTYATTGTAATTENILVTVWRVPCSSSGQAVPYNTNGAKNAITLVRLDRADDSVTTVIPLRPRLLFTQGSVSYGVIRVAIEPNTVLSEASYAVPMPSSATYVLENYPGTGMQQFDYRSAFKLNVLGGTGTSVDINIPAYEPTQETYPDAFGPIALDGYSAAQWYNASRNEGVIVQVAEAYDGANPMRRQLIIDLLTKDNAGNPFWIVGGAAFDPVAGGLRSLVVPVAYLVQNNAIADWGSIQVVQRNCNQLELSFTPKPDLAQGIPVITGTVSYVRLLSANGMLCE